jgi:hypothetical protein
LFAKAIRMQKMTRHLPAASRSRRRGYVLPAVLLFLSVSFAVWASLYRSTAMSLRVEEACLLRSDRTQWLAPAVAEGLRLLETGDPPSSVYECKVAITRNGTTRWFRLGFTRESETRWLLSCDPVDADSILPEAPSSF